MSKKCVICGSTENSKEHVFPAALGGRRVNKGIYCRKHNNMLGSHVSALMKSLEYFNAAMGVRADRRDSPRPFRLKTDSGETYEVLGDRVDFAPPHNLEDREDLLNDPVDLRFTSNEQYEKWVKEQNKMGYKVEKLDESPKQTHFFSEPLQISLNFGGDEYRCAIAYLGFTFFANHFPKIAAQKGFEDIRLCLLGKQSIADRVWWVDPKNIEETCESDFDSVHSVSVLILVDGNCYAQVSLFSRLCMTVFLGVAEQPDSSRAIRTLINPKADRAAPDLDVKVQDLDYSSFFIGSPEEGKEFVSAILKNEADNPVEFIIQRILEQQLNDEVEKIFDQLHATKDMPKEQQLGEISKVIDEQRQRIFNHIQAGVQEFVGKGIPKKLEDNLMKMIQPDERSATGLTENAQMAIEKAKNSLINEVAECFTEGVLTKERLRNYLAGGEGRAAMLKPLFQDAIDKI